MKSYGLGSLVLAGSLLLAGCGGDSNGSSSSDRSTDTQSTASVRALHLSPDARRWMWPSTIPWCWKM